MPTVSGSLGGVRRDGTERTHSTFHGPSGYACVEVLHPGSGRIRRGEQVGASIRQCASSTSRWVPAMIGERQGAARRWPRCTSALHQQAMTGAADEFHQSPSITLMTKREAARAQRLVKVRQSVAQVMTTHRPSVRTVEQSIRRQISPPNPEVARGDAAWGEPAQRDLIAPVPRGTGTGHSQPQLKRSAEQLAHQVPRKCVTLARVRHAQAAPCA